jgi:Na+/melibiose symporter-like transporter
MEFDVAVLGIVIGMMILANRLVAALITPIFDKYKLDHFGLMYIAWIISGALVWLTGANLFAPYIPNALIGQILTAIVAGGGSNLLHDLTDKPTVDLYEMTMDEDEPVG